MSDAGLRVPADPTGSTPQIQYNLVVTGVLSSVTPFIVGFLSPQRYWCGGLAVGGLKGA